MGEFDLQAPFRRPRPRAEDFENERSAVEHLRVPFLFEVPVLNGRQRMIDNDKAGARIARVEHFANLLDLARAKECRRTRAKNRRDHRLDNVEIDRRGQAHRLFKARLVAPRRGFGLNGRKDDEGFR